MKFESVLILHLDVSEFEFYSLKFGDIWNLHLKILKFEGVNFKHPQTLGSKTQTPLKLGGKSQTFKCQDVKSKFPHISGEKIQILKL